MIHFFDVTHGRTATGAPILHRCFFEVAARERIGILAMPSSGKSTLVRLMTGIEKPEQGHIEIAGQLSWPIGFAGWLHPDLSTEENLSILCQLRGEDPVRVLAFLKGFLERGGALDRPIRFVSPAARSNIAYAISMAFPADIYVADETLLISSRNYTDKCIAVLEKRLMRSGLIFVSRNPAQLKNHCTRFFVLLDGKIIPCENPETGAEALRLYDAQQSVIKAEGGHVPATF